VPTYERGPERTAVTLAAHFQRLADRGLLRLDDPVRAAHYFNWLVTSVPLNQVMLCGDTVQFTTADLEDFADTGVRVFLAAYGQP
jgi:TetR/AcrR family transcriptional regulator, mexJK operon transcriptional repressor